jgi:hypothetical protein
MLSSLRRQRRLGTDYSGSFGYGGKRNLGGSLSEFPSEFFTCEKLGTYIFDTTWAIGGISRLPPKVQKAGEMKEFASAIYTAVQSRRLAEPFGADAVRRECPGWADRTYHVFLPKHAVGNPGRNTELFVRVSPGLYRLLHGRA